MKNPNGPSIEDVEAMRDELAEQQAMSPLEINLQAALVYLDTGNEDAVRYHIGKAMQLARQVRCRISHPQP